MTVVVVGAGVAGTAAALGAARAGARVTVVDGGSGASTLWTGKVDYVPIEVTPELGALASELGVVLGRSILVTTNGYPPAAFGHEASLLDLHAVLAKKPAIGVVRCPRPGWNADGIERSAGEGFFALDATVLRHADERLMADAELAERHDDDARLGWLAERLREGIARSGITPTGLLLPPLLGLRQSRAADLAKLVGVPCGEAMGLPGGPCGLRVEAARDRSFAAAGVSVVRGRARGVVREGTRWRVDVDGETLAAAAVVVAAGGLVGGGLAYQPSEAMEAAALPTEPRPPFACSVGGPLPLGAHGEPLDVPGSLFGVPPEQLAWPLARDPLMERVGVLAAEDGRVEKGLYVAGELVADRPRTWLHALSSGMRAGAAAARDAEGLTSPAESTGPTGPTGSPGSARLAPAGAPASRP
ncbi:MAG TPA: FAD-binding protein [Polyangiaceae bacterium]|jgi:glycerol-3-phosphate dehydrogenase subunit B